ncbi:hypothetical protein S83_043102, partial [Arachis hypogaea]
GNAIFSSSSLFSLVRLPSPPQHASSAAPLCVRRQERSARVTPFSDLLLSGSPTLAATTRIVLRRSLRPPPLPASAAKRGQLSSTPLLVEDDKPSKEKVSGPSSRLAAAPSDVASSVPGMPYKAIGGLIGTLMEQNAQAFNQI